MIRVLQYIGSLAQGGSQAMIMNLYRNIDKAQIQFDFVIQVDGIHTTYAQEVQSMGARIYTCPRYSLKTAKKYDIWWNKFFEEHSEYRIVHSHIRSTASIVLGIAKKYGCKTIAHSHSTSSGSGLSCIIKNVLQYRIRFVADYYIGCSQVAGEWLFGKKICASARYFNVPNAIDTEKFIFNKEESLKARKELGFKKNDIVIGHVGRFSEPKNHGFLVDIFRDLHMENGNYRLLLVGDGELKADIERKVRQYELDDAVIFAGVRTDVNRLLMAMDLFLFPSKWEGLPVSVVEAQAVGLPCVISKSVTSEVCITDLVERIDINAPVVEWVNVIRNRPISERKNMRKKIEDSGYDIRTSVKWISDFYISIS